MALAGGEWSAACPGCFTPRERARSTHWVGGLGGPQSRSGQHREEKILNPTRAQTQKPWSSSP
jgi:hypothetical protein